MQEFIYSVLIVSSVEKFTETIKKLLGTDSFSPIKVVNSIASAKREMLEREYDICLINSPLSDSVGSDFAVDMADSTNTGILMFVKPELYDEVYDKTSKYGILLLAKPVTGSVFKQTIRLLCSSRERIGRLTNRQIKEKKTLAERLEEIRIINTAKLLLIEHKKMSEEEAHKYLEKRAMDLRKNKIDIAKDTIAEMHKLGGTNEN